MHRPAGTFSENQPAQHRSCQASAEQLGRTGTNSLAASASTTVCTFAGHGLEIDKPMTSRLARARPIQYRNSSLRGHAAVERDDRSPGAHSTHTVYCIFCHLGGVLAGNHSDEPNAMQQQSRDTSCGRTGYRCEDCAPIMKGMNLRIFCVVCCAGSSLCAGCEICRLAN